MTERSGKPKKIAIIGAGPAGMYLYKTFIESGMPDIEIHIYEKKGIWGAGMPYSTDGANAEHITNVSDNEIPPLVTSIEEWIAELSDAELKKYGMSQEYFSTYKVLPRLFFGAYLSAQFKLLLMKGELAGVPTVLHERTIVEDVIDHPDHHNISVVTNGGAEKYDHVVICTGHYWPKTHEGKTAGYFDSPYPPSKLKNVYDHPVAIRGSSLTAIDALRTLARQHGSFTKKEDGTLLFQLNEENPNFRIVMHSKSGLLPALRFHLDSSRLAPDNLLSEEEIETHIKHNGGYLSLDFIFENDFKALIRSKDPEFYEEIKSLSMEDFVEKMMALREELDPFILLRAEYREAEKSIKRKQSVYWKELLAALSFAMNYPAKYFSAEDMLRLQKTLMPLISIVIAFIPQSSCLEMLALHDAGKLALVAVGNESRVTVTEEGSIVYAYEAAGKPTKQRFKTFIDCIGQSHLNVHDLPFTSLVKQEAVKQAQIKFRDAQKGAEAREGGNKNVVLSEQGDYLMNVSGIAISDSFRVADRFGVANPRISLMAVPYIGGYNPDYSGLDFCEAASHKIIAALKEQAI